MTITATTTAGAPVSVQFQTALLHVAQAQCPYFAGVTPATIRSRQGAELVAKWRRVTNLTVSTSALSELTGSESYPLRTGTQLSVVDITATAAKYGAFILLNEEVDLENLTSMNAGYAKALGIQAGRTLNQLQRNEEEDNSTIYRVANAATDALIAYPLRKTDVDYAVNWINRQDGVPFTDQTFGSDNYGTDPVEPAFKGVCHPDVEEDIRNHAGFTPAAEYGAHTRLERYEFGKTGRVRWVSSSDSSVELGVGGIISGNVRKATGTGLEADVYNTVIYAQDAYGSVGLDTAHIKESYLAGDELPGIMVINKGLGSAGTADPLNEVRTMGWKTWHAAKVISEQTALNQTKWCLCIRSLATLIV